MFKALIQITCYRANLEKSEQSQYWESHYNIFDYLVQRWRSLKRAQPTRLKSICQRCDKKSRCSWSSQQSRAETEKRVTHVETPGACEGGWSWMSSGIDIDNNIDTHYSKTLKKEWDADNYFGIAIDFDTGYKNCLIFAQKLWFVKNHPNLHFCLKIYRQGKTENQLRISDSESLERNTS